MYDHDGDDCIDGSHVMNALRGAGYNPAEDELVDLMRKYGPKPGKYMGGEQMPDWKHKVVKSGAKSEDPDWVLETDKIVICFHFLWLLMISDVFRWSNA